MKGSLSIPQQRPGVDNLNARLHLEGSLTVYVVWEFYHHHTTPHYLSLTTFPLSAWDPQSGRTVLNRQVRS